jgi:hypothetical protein
MDPSTACSINGCGRPARAKNLCSPHYKRQWRNGSPTAGRVTPGTRFDWMERHKDFAGAECLVWPFSTVRGYAAVMKNGRTVYVHRTACEHRNGPPPTPQHQAAHSCGNRRCVNPSHIRWATRSENEADKEIHGTRVRGSQSKFAKLTERDVLAIRDSQLPQLALAEAYGVHQSQISNIKNKKAWAWLP